VSESPGQVENRDALVPSRHLLENLEGIVTAAVEYVNHSKDETR
jgi:hypothetical protein